MATSIITVIVPLTTLYHEAYVAFWRQFGCHVTVLNDSSSCHITFPSGTIRESCKLAGEPRLQLRLPDQTTIAEVQVHGHSYLYPINIADRQPDRATDLC